MKFEIEESLEDKELIALLIAISVVFPVPFKSLEKKRKFFESGLVLLKFEV
jgi:hypothetical protein